MACMCVQAHNLHELRTCRLITCKPATVILHRQQGTCHLSKVALHSPSSVDISPTDHCHSVHKCSHILRPSVGGLNRDCYNGDDAEHACTVEVQAACAYSYLCIERLLSPSRAIFIIKLSSIVNREHLGACVAKLNQHALFALGSRTCVSPYVILIIYVCRNIVHTAPEQGLVSVPRCQACLVPFCHLSRRLPAHAHMHTHTQP